MADRIIKPDSGNDVVIQNNGGTRKIEVTNAGDVEVTGDFKATTVKATNLKANDGTAGLSIADSTGRVTFNESNPVIALGSNATGFTGVKVLDLWRLSSNLTSVSSPIDDSYLERVTTTDIGTIGSPMTVDSNGIFEFPMTGIYTIDFSATLNLNNSAQYIGLIIRKVISGSDSILVRKYSHIQRVNSAHTYVSMYLNTTFDCSDTSTHKVRFDYAESHSATATLIGDTSTNSTTFKFMRIGDI